MTRRPRRHIRAGRLPVYTRPMAWRGWQTRGCGVTLLTLAFVGALAFAAYITWLSVRMGW